MIGWIKSKILDKILWIIDLANDKDVQNIERYLHRKSLIETADFVEENMINVASFPDDLSLIKYSLNLTSINGLFLEFGVFEGRTINFISSNINQLIYGFDSFEGLPEDWRSGFEKGTFKIEKLPKFNDNVKLIKGWFEDTLPPFIEKNQENCSFIHVDCDLYSSTQTIFKYLKDKITNGTIIVFDEFFNYPGWKNGEYKAFMEFIETYNVKFEYLGYCRYNEQVAVKILSV